jgi:hypothetical protein
VRLAASVPQNPGDEKTGEDEEKRNAGPAEFDENAHRMDQRLPGLCTAAVMKDDDEQHCHTSYSIEGSDMLSARDFSGIGLGHVNPFY